MEVGAWEWELEDPVGGYLSAYFNVFAGET